ncbi:hypothetical protein AB0B50_21010 [Streptomyces sp. NPDC041068]|uniref:hypothetical protein n=1 Tax=Streptomyces sp. NPDC041068 TaxID=3155130 RepID=UPI0033CC486F
MEMRLIPVTAAAVLALAGCGVLDAEEPEPVDVTEKVLSGFPGGPTADKARGYVDRVLKADDRHVEVTFTGRLPDGWVRYQGDSWDDYIAALVMKSADAHLGPCHHSVTLKYGEDAYRWYGRSHCPVGGGS